MRDTDKAFPVRRRWDSESGGYDLDDSGMTLSQYAAIHLKVPRSGDKDIDDMILESRRLDFAEKASFDGNMRFLKEEVHRAFGFVDALLAEWEKEERDERGG
jgi:hypothetical protein